MPRADFGQPIKIGGGLFLKLKSKGEAVNLRFASGAIYEGKHFIKQEGETTVTFCPRIMDDLDCDYCEKSFEYARLAKEEKDLKKKKALEESARNIKAKIAFYFPIVDRGDGRAKILQTVITVRQDLEEEVKAGVKVIDHDYILTRTEISPANYYSLVRAPETKPLSAAEQEEFEKAGELNIEKILKHGGKESKLDLEGKDAKGNNKSGS